MKRKILLLLMAALLPASVFAASDWKGKVVDENGEPVPFANVVALSKADSAVVTGTTTSDDGTFRVVTDGKNQLLMISMIGYKTVCLSPSDNITITLLPDVQFLEGAVVTAVIPKVTLTGDGLQTSVHGTVLETVGTANDVLARTPGIIRSNDGLQVVGKGTPLVYVNGRRVSDLTELDRLPSNEIQSVDVISNPGVQYSASASSVVRIRTVRHQGDGFGFNAGITDEQSLHSGYNDPSGYLKVNFRHNGLDVFAGANAAKSTSRFESEMVQETFGTPGFRQEGTLDRVETMAKAGVNGGFNWQISDSHSVGFRVEAEMKPKVDVHQLLDEDIFEGGILSDHLIAEGNDHNDNMPFGVSTNAYYNGRVGKLGIDFNADYYCMKTSQDAHTVEKSAMGPDDDVSYLSHSGNYLFAAKLVLSYPVWIGMLQAGVEDVFSRRDDRYAINSLSVPSSASKVREDNMAIFASYGFSLPKAGQFYAGLRYEHVNYAYEDLMGTDNIDRKHDNFFPTFSYSNAFGPVKVQLNYSVKTQRPDFESLSSAVRYHSRYVYQSGNAKLQPQVNHEFGLAVNWNWLTLAAQCVRVDKAITEWSELYNNHGVVIVHPTNLDHPFEVLTWYLNASPTIGVWTLNCSAGMQHQWLSLDMPDPREASGLRSVSFNGKPMFFVKMFNAFKFRNAWQVEFGGLFRNKAYWQNTMLTNNYLDLTAAVQKSFLDNALVLRLEGTDLAGLGQFDIMTDCGSHITDRINRQDTQRIKFSITYNFNTAQSKYKGTGAGADVKSRMK